MIFFLGGFFSMQACESLAQVDVSQGNQEDRHGSSARISGEQMQEMLDVLGALGTARHEAVREFDAQKKDMPPWFPDSVLRLALSKAAEVDQAPIDLPFYQVCLSSRDARLWIDIFKTPEGRAYGQKITGLELDAQREGQNAGEAAVSSGQSLDLSVLRKLDRADQDHAKEMLAPQRSAEMGACMADAFARSTAKLQAAELIIMSSVFQEHHEEMPQHGSNLKPVTMVRQTIIEPATRMCGRAPLKGIDGCWCQDWSLPRIQFG